MQIHVARNSSQLGVFSSEEILAGLSAGRFHATDLAWREGMQGWTPLGDWPEFRAVGVPASPGASPAATPVASTIPWEQGKSLGSFFATIKMALANPSALSTGRFAFGDWLGFCYLAVLVAMPFQLAGALAYGDKNEQIAELLRGLSLPGMDKAVEQLARTEPTPPAFMVFGILGGLATAPLLYALFGVFHWVGQRLFRYQLSLEKTVAASLLVTALSVLLMAPLQLLGFSLVLQMGLSLLLLVPVCVLYYRAFGAATGIGPWVQFGISCLVWFVLCCCCCAAPAGLFASLAAKAIH
jgi:hypothetical protein